MKRKKSHVVHTPKSDRMKGVIHVGTITVEDQLKADRAARRQAQIDSGVFIRGGVHGGGKKERNKRDRRDSRQQCRNFRNGGDE